MAFINVQGEVNQLIGNILHGLAVVAKFLCNLIHLYLPKT